jgi:hypothetical protein
VAAYTTDMRARFIDEHDPVRCAELMAAMAASDTWWTPTLQVLRMSALAGNREFREDPRRRYIPFIFWAGLWQPDADRAVADARHASGRDVHAELYRLAMDNVRQAHNAGVRIVAGKVADMILLNANPLTDIRSTGKIAGLFFNGQYLDRAALDELLAFAEDQAGSLRTNLQLLWGALRSPVVWAQAAD